MQHYADSCCINFDHNENENKTAETQIRRHWDFKPKKPRHLDPKTKKPRHRDSKTKKLRHRGSKAKGLRHQESKARGAQHWDSGAKGPLHRDSRARGPQHRDWATFFRGVGGRGIGVPGPADFLFCYYYLLYLCLTWTITFCHNSVYRYHDGK